MATKVFRDLMKNLTPRQKKKVEDRVTELLLELRAAEYAKLQLGRNWDSLTPVEQRKVIEAVQEQDQNKNTSVS